MIRVDQPIIYSIVLALFVHRDRREVKKGQILPLKTGLKPGDAAFVSPGIDRRKIFFQTDLN